MLSNFNSLKISRHCENNNLFFGLSNAVSKQRASGGDDGDVSGNTLGLNTTK